MSNANDATQSSVSPVTPMMRAVVLTVAFAGLVGGGTLASSDLSSEIGLLDIAAAAVSNMVAGLVSGFGLAVRLLAGLLVVSPLDHVVDVIFARPNALSLRSIFGQAVGAIASTAALPWLDPPLRMWRWTASGAGTEA